MNNKTNTRRFIFDRTEDVSGVSGVGIVADGALFHNGFTVLTWRSKMLCFEVWHSVDEMMKVHGHENRTKLVWIDEE